MTNSYSVAVQLAEATGYGQGSYSTSTYNSCAEGDTTCQVAVDSGSTPGAPNTGVLQQPLFVVPVVIGLALLLVGAELLIRRYIRKMRLSRKTSN